VVDNRPGAGGNVAMEIVARSAPDGYTVVMGTIGTCALNPSLYANLPFSVQRDFAPVMLVGSIANLLAVHPSVPATSVKELVALAKARPGTLTYASSGFGSSLHVAGELFRGAATVDLVHVPYKGGQPAEQDLLAGQVDMFLAPYGKRYDDFAKQGKLKLLAMLNKERLESVKGHPAISESKQLKDFAFNIWTGYFVKRDTPEPVVQRLHKASTDTLSDPSVRAGLEAHSLLLASPLPLDAVGKAYADGTAQFRAIAKAIDLQPQ